MTYKTSDFIKFDNAFACDYGDFSGKEEAFAQKKGLNFLKNITRFCKENIMRKNPGRR